VIEAVMSYKRFSLAVLTAWIGMEILGTVVHGFLLANDYAPFYGTLLRGSSNGGGPDWRFAFLPVAHFCFVAALVWIYSRVGFRGGLLAQGLKLGSLSWLIGQVPLWLVWYAEQPWPDSLVAKQLALELVVALLVGLLIAAFGPRQARAAH
jgi:hypothetical protein